MTTQSTTYPSRITRHAEQGAHPAISSQVAVEKSATKNKKNKKPQLINASMKTTISTLNTTQDMENTIINRLRSNNRSRYSMYTQVHTRRYSNKRT